MNLESTCVTAGAACTQDATAAGSSLFPQRMKATRELAMHVCPPPLRMRTACHVVSLDLCALQAVALSVFRVGWLVSIGGVVSVSVFMSRGHACWQMIV